MLADSDLIASLATSDPARARDVYAGALGLRLVEDNRFALAFDDQPRTGLTMIFAARAGLPTRFVRGAALRPAPTMTLTQFS